MSTFRHISDSPFPPYSCPVHHQGVRVIGVKTQRLEVTGHDGKAVGDTVTDGVKGFLVASIFAEQDFP